jgi:aryl-alcohol dehydrogenase-like predicted oxidoreductase
MSSGPIENVVLGNSGLSLCRVGCGTGTIAGGKQSNQTRLGADTFYEVLRYAYDRGIRFFDTADSYGTHNHLARLMGDVAPGTCQLATKFFVDSATPETDIPVDQFLAELKTEMIDLLQIHCVTDANWPEHCRKQMVTLAAMKARGVLRAHGVSCHSLEALSTAADEPWVDVIHARINPFNVAMDAEVDKVVPILERAKANGKGVIAMKIFGQGDLDATQRAESIAWLAERDCIDVLLPAFESPAEINECLDLLGYG